MILELAIHHEFLRLSVVALPSTASGVSSTKPSIGVAHFALWHRENCNFRPIYGNYDWARKLSTKSRVPNRTSLGHIVCRPIRDFAATTRNSAPRATADWSKWLFVRGERDDSVIEHNYNHYKVVKRTLFELLLQDYPRYGNGHVFISMYQGEEHQTQQSQVDSQPDDQQQVIPVGSPNSSQNDDIENNDENCSEDGNGRSKGSKKVRKPRTIYRYFIQTDLFYYRILARISYKNSCVDSQKLNTWHFQKELNLPLILAWLKHKERVC